MQRDKGNVGRVHGNHCSTQQHARTARVEMITLLFPGLIQKEQLSVFSGCGGGGDGMTVMVSHTQHGTILGGTFPSRITRKETLNAANYIFERSKWGGT